MKTYVENLLTRLERVVNDGDILPYPRYHQPGDKLAIVMLTHVIEEGEPIEAILPCDVDTVVAIPPQQWKENLRPFDINCIFAEVTDAEADVYEIKALLAPGIAERYPDVDINAGPRFVAAIRKEDMTWDYEHTDNFTWCDTPSNVGKYPYPVDLNVPLYVDLEFVLISMIGVDAMFKTSIEHIIQFFVSYQNGDPEEVLKWAQQISKRFLNLHHLTYLHTLQTSHTLH